ncbi:MAG: TolC family protein [Bryobacteraceae bacterium]|nr:TolC family protein [Bryobacteraceae bacterium]
MMRPVALLVLTLLPVVLSAADSWWKVYGDPQLDALVEKALTANVDLQSATQRIAEARALRGGSRSALLPSLDVTGSAQRLRGGFQQGVVRIPRASGEVAGGTFVAPFETNIFSGGLDMKWELDLFGGNRAALAASSADVQAEAQLREDLAISVSAEVARTYLELRGAEERLLITQRSRDTQADVLGLTKTRAEAGLATQLDVERQETLLANTEANLPALENERVLRLTRLAVLTTDQSLVTRPLATPSAVVSPKLDATGIDSTLLRRRPDVRAAETRIQAALSRLRVARSDLYPKINLNGLLGRQSTTVSGLSLGGGNFFSIGPQLTLPIFSGGRIRSNIAVNDARVEQARLTYQNEILLAFEEAEKAISGYRQQQARTAKLDAAVSSSARSLELSRELNTAGIEDFLTVLDAQRSVFDAELQRSESNTTALVESVRLYKALAGGWPQP